MNSEKIERLPKIGKLYRVTEKVPWYYILDANSIHDTIVRYTYPESVKRGLEVSSLILVIDAKANANTAPNNFFRPPELYVFDLIQVLAESLLTEEPVKLILSFPLYIWHTFLIEAISATDV